MKYLWSASPPKGISGVSAAKSNVWPKPLKETLKYSVTANRHKITIAIGQLKNGRWEVYVWKPVSFSKGNNGDLTFRYLWRAHSRMHKSGTYRLGYSNYANCYRSITQALKGLQ